MYSIVESNNLKESILITMNCRYKANSYISNLNKLNNSKKYRLENSGYKLKTSL